MYSSNDRYYAAKMAAERREMMMQRATRSDSRYQVTHTAVAPMPRAFGLSASLAPLSLLPLILSILVIIILALVLIPLGL